MLEIFTNGYDIVGHIGDSFYFLLIFIVLDVFTGVLVAIRERELNSSINLNGLIRKLGLVTGIFFVTVVDVFLQMDGVIIKIGVSLLIVYEVFSIIENLSRIGINLKFITKYFDKEKVGGDDNVKDKVDK